MTAGGLQVRRLTTPHLRAIDLDLAPGECVGITGPSGSGKSLLLRALADMDPFEGQISLGGESVHSMPAPQWRRRVALLPATSAWWYDSVGPHFRRVDTPAYEALGFPPEVADWEIRRLSSGERQRLSLLRLLAMRPEVLLLDEPTANLDAANTRRAEALITAYIRQRMAATLWVSHDRDQLERLCARGYRLVAGRLNPLFNGRRGN
ncbi:MAG: ATP-binding cassette domain-containing protein [Desulfosarcinaceae bacterium]|nr:ATP-binding cassette domain-containing protein [Desulfosarcinaceae bacterium]